MKFALMKDPLYSPNLAGSLIKEDTYPELEGIVSWEVCFILLEQYQTRLFGIKNVTAKFASTGGTILGPIYEPDTENLVTKHLPDDWYETGFGHWVEKKQDGREFHWRDVKCMAPVFEAEDFEAAARLLSELGFSFRLKLDKYPKCDYPVLVITSLDEDDWELLA